jgi:hypothetical protein
MDHNHITGGTDEMGWDGTEGMEIESNSSTKRIDNNDR